LSGKKLAIDASIWILQLLNSRHRKGKTRAYISGLYLRLGKLLSFGIHPLVVFDGATPQLKSQVCRLRSLSKRRREEQYRQVLLELLAAKLLRQDGPSPPAEEKEASPDVSVSSSSEEDESEKEENRVEFEAANEHLDSFSRFQLRKYCSSAKARTYSEVPTPEPRKLACKSKDPELSPRRLAALIRLGIIDGNSEETHQNPIESTPTSVPLPSEPMKSWEEDSSSSSDSASEIEVPINQTVKQADISIDIATGEQTHFTNSRYYEVEKTDSVIAETAAIQLSASLPSQSQPVPLSPPQSPSVDLPVHPAPHSDPSPTIPSLSDHIQSLEAQIRLFPLPDDLSKEEIKEEIQQLLRILGIPWVDSPMEAEAQCAELEMRGDVDGVVTEDSDALLFGARQVYRGLLSNSTEVESYSAAIIQQDLGLTRAKLVALAQLLGCDYHPGVPGIGPVLAVELIEVFPDLMELKRVMEEQGKGTEEQRKLVKSRAKALKRVKEVESLPDPEVQNAYFSPIVDKTPLQFHWFPPQIPQLRTFLMQKLSWSEERSLAFTHPLQNQTASSVFFSTDYYKQEKKKELPKSKRMRKALKIG
jgi:5'-3' exonuclease